MCSGTIASLRDPWEQLSINTVVLEMGKLRHGGGGGMCRVSQFKIQKSPSSGPCITYLPISTISSLISSTEVASCVPGLAQVRIRLGKQLELSQSCSPGPKPHTTPAPSSQRFS